MSQRIRLFMKSECKERSDNRSISYNFKRIYKSKSSFNTLDDYFKSAKKKLSKIHHVVGRNRLFTPPSTRPQTMTPFSIGYNTEAWGGKLKIEEATSETEGLSTNLPEQNRVFSANDLNSKRNKIIKDY